MSHHGKFKPLPQYIEDRIARYEKAACLEQPIPYEPLTEDEVVELTNLPHVVAGVPVGSDASRASGMMPPADRFVDIDLE